MNHQLEQSVLYAATQGHLTPDLLKPHLGMFSKEGKVVHQGIKWFLDHGQLPPYTPESIALVCHETLGHGTEEIESYVKEMMGHVVGKEIEAVLQSASDKLTLLEIQKLVVDQMADNTFDPIAFQSALTKVAPGKVLKNLSEQMKGGEEHVATRIALGDELTSLQSTTGGLRGFWVVGGMQGSGKSTLAWQVSLQAAESRPVLYYDMENTAAVLYDRTREMFGGDADRADAALRQVFVRPDPRTLFRDLLTFSQPVLIVIDSLQALPMADKNGKQENIEGWLSKLDRLKHSGHHIIAVSQLTRGANTFKWTNDIEHKADFGIRMESPTDNPMMSKVYVEKNRHGVKRGYLCLLRRENSWVLVG